MIIEAGQCARVINDNVSMLSLNCVSFCLYQVLRFLCCYYAGMSAGLTPLHPHMDSNDHQPTKFIIVFETELKTLLAILMLDL